MPEEIVVVGGGGFGRETLDVIEAMNSAVATPRWIVVGVVDDAPAERNVRRLAQRGYTIMSTTQALAARPPAWYVVGIGNPAIKRRMAADFDANGWRAAALIHPSAVVGSEVQISPGSVVCGGVQLSTNTRLGAHVHLNPGAIIGHDSVLEDFVSVNPGAVVSGEVTVGTGVLIGAGAVILQGLTVGRGSAIGASACVIRPVSEGETVAGVPARPLHTSGGTT